MTQTPGAFGGAYNHDVIKAIRAELAQKNIILAALVEHTKIPQDELNKVVEQYMLRLHEKMLAQHKKG